MMSATVSVLCFLGGFLTGALAMFAVIRWAVRGGEISFPGHTATIRNAGEIE